MLIVGINIALLIAYTLTIRLCSPSAYGGIFVAFLIVIHFLICVLLAAFIKNYRKGFLLSAAAVLLIGFSTCYLAYSVH